jgi:hypothetical protein
MIEMQMSDHEFTVTVQLFEHGRKKINRDLLKQCTQTRSWQQDYAKMHAGIRKQVFIDLIKA